MGSNRTSLVLNKAGILTHAGYFIINSNSPAEVTSMLIYTKLLLSLHMGGIF